MLTFLKPIIVVGVLSLSQMVFVENVAAKQYSDNYRSYVKLVSDTIMAYEDSGKNPEYFYQLISDLPLEKQMQLLGILVDYEDDPVKAIPMAEKIDELKEMFENQFK